MNSTDWSILVALLLAAVVGASVAYTILCLPDPEAHYDARQRQRAAALSSLDALQAPPSGPAEPGTEEDLAPCWLAGGAVKLDRIECLSRGGRLTKLPENEPETAGTRSAGRRQPSRRFFPFFQPYHPGRSSRSWPGGSSAASSSRSRSVGVQRSSDGTFSGNGSGIRRPVRGPVTKSR
jgi:hypothetical protein